MVKTAWLGLGIAVVIACSNHERGGPKGGTGPGMTTGVGGQLSSGAGGAMTPVECDDEGVSCQSEIYHGDCTEFPSKRTLWTFLSYDTMVPNDARIEFAVRTADSEEELATATFHVASVAEMGSEFVPPSVPIHLDDVLSTADVTRAWLELRFKLVLSGEGESPSVVEWDLYFSCEDV